MARSQSFSIYLLKTSYNSSNSLKAEHALVEAVNPTSLPNNARLFILDAAPKEPWWKSYFGVQENLLQQYKGALVFVEASSRCFALAFGQVAHFLEETSYEYDFGIRVTLNSLDPKEIRSADMVDPGVARRKRTQVPNSTELTYLDFDSNSEIIKSLTGKVKEEFKELFATATGSSSLKINLNVQPEDLVEICEQLFSLYSGEQYKVSFPNIQNIVPVKDPVDIDALNNLLMQALNSRNDGVLLFVPEIVVYSDVSFCRFMTGGTFGSLYGDISIGSLFDHLDENGGNITFTLESAKSDRFYLTDSQGDIRRSFSIYRSLVFDTHRGSDASNVYHLCEGNWYRVDTNFSNRLSNYIDSKCKDSNLIDYNHDKNELNKKSYSEENYNSAVAASDGEYICLDRTDISPSGNSQIEPCDIYTVRPNSDAAQGDIGVLYHIKISTDSAKLSHLFNQGVNSIEVLKLEEESRLKMKDLLRDFVPLASIDRFIGPIDTGNFEVIFGIITDKLKVNKSSNLPLFSKISLMRNMTRLDVMSVANSLIFINDASGGKSKVNLNKYIDVEINAGPNGDGVVVPLPGQWHTDLTPIARCSKNLKGSPVGSRFKIRVDFDAQNKLYTHFKWSYVAI